jgi:hypothetical protein
MHRLPSLWIGCPEEAANSEGCVAPPLSHYLLIMHQRITACGIEDNEGDWLIGGIAW